MLKSILLLLLVLPSVFFQACGEAGHDTQEETFNVLSVFPYSKNTQYYDDVQIVEKSKSGNLWNYGFIASVVDSLDEDSEIDVEIKVLDDNQSLVCPRFRRTVSRQSNHIQIDNCTSGRDLSSIKVETYAGPKGQGLSYIRTIEMDLSGI